jgi:hypothetical protein
MRKLTIPGCALVLLLVSSTAWAGGDSGLYLGGSLGSAGLDVSAGNVSYDDNDMAYKIFGGYNSASSRWSMSPSKRSYVDFGTAEGSVLGNSVETGVTGLDASGLAGTTWA